MWGSPLRYRGPESCLQMYLFNPEHDLCLANGDIHFVPPRSALDFGRGCGSIVEFMQGLDSDADRGARIVPWGWNPHLKERLLREGVAPELLPSQEQLKSIREFSHRSFALEAHNFLLDYMVAIPGRLEGGLAPAECRESCRTVGEVCDGFSFS